MSPDDTGTSARSREVTYIEEKGTACAHAGHQRNQPVSADRVAHGFTARRAHKLAPAVPNQARSGAACAASFRPDAQPVLSAPFDRHLGMALALVSRGNRSADEFSVGRATLAVLPRRLPDGAPRAGAPTSGSSSLPRPITSGSSTGATRTTCRGAST